MSDLVNDEPWNQCFGCSPHNERGLRLTFQRGDDGVVETRIEVPEHFVGPPGTVHGGIQAVLLDEVMGMAARLSSSQSEGGTAVTDGGMAQTEGGIAVTADLRLKYRRPAPHGRPLRVRGRPLRSEGRDLYVAGEILGPDGEVLTEAEGRFVVLEKRPGPR